MTKPGKYHGYEPRTITQAELRMLLDLMEPARQQTELRRDIIERLDAGADVEPGELMAQIELGHHAQPSWGALAKFFSAKLVEHVRDFIDTVPVRHLRVYDQDGEPRPWGARALKHTSLRDEFSPTLPAKRKIARSKPRKPR